MISMLNDFGYLQTLSRRRGRAPVHKSTLDLTTIWLAAYLRG